MNPLNGKAKVSLHWLGGATLGALSAIGILYDVRSREIATIQNTAGRLATIEATVAGLNSQLVEIKIDVREIRLALTPAMTRRHAVRGCGIIPPFIPHRSLMSIYPRGKA